jgi:hypothetical protein
MSKSRRLGGASFQRAWASNKSVTGRIRVANLPEIEAGLFFLREHTQVERSPRRLFNALAKGIADLSASWTDSSVGEHG